MHAHWQSLSTFQNRSRGTLVSARNLESCVTPLTKQGPLLEGNILGFIGNSLDICHEEKPGDPLLRKTPSSQEGVAERPMAELPRTSTSQPQQLRILPLIPMTHCCCRRYYMHRNCRELSKMMVLAIDGMVGARLQLAIALLAKNHLRPSRQYAMVCGPQEPHKR